MTDEEMDALDEAMFGCGDSSVSHYPCGNELSLGAHFLNGRESGAGPDIDSYTIADCLGQGYTKAEIAEALRKKADEIES